MRVPYRFAILRYMHDAVTQEFVNVGVVVYCESARYFQAICTRHYARLSALFQEVDGVRFRQVTSYVEDQVNRLGERLRTELPFAENIGLERLLAQVLPPDDSALQFSSKSVGITVDPSRSLQDLYARHVEMYRPSADNEQRTDEDVWRVFRDPLQRLDVTPYLQPKRIIAPNYEHEFSHAWKYGTWHLYEPVSFDLQDSRAIVEKATRWVGRANGLEDSREPFTLHLLLGEPQDERLHESFLRAQRLLEKMPGNREFVRESEAEEFAERMAREVLEHQKQ